MVRRLKIVIISFLAIIIFFVWLFLTYNLEERIINSKGFIINQSQEIELSFEFNPIWIPRNPGEINELNILIYEEHSTQIYLNEIINQEDDKHAVVKLKVVPTFDKKGGSFVYPYIVGDSGSVKEIHFQPLFYDNSGKRLDWNIGKFSGPGKQFGFIISHEDYQNIDHPIQVKYGKLNLITYEPTNN